MPAKHVASATCILETDEKRFTVAATQLQSFDLLLPICRHLDLNRNPSHCFLIKDKKPGQITVEEKKNNQEIIITEH